MMAILVTFDCRYFAASVPLIGHMPDFLLRSRLSPSPLSIVRDAHMVCECPVLGYQDLGLNTRSHSPGCQISSCSSHKLLPSLPCLSLYHLLPSTHSRLPPPLIQTQYHGLSLYSTETKPEPLCSTKSTPSLTRLLTLKQVMSQCVLVLLQ